MSIKLDIEKLQAYLPKIFTELRHKNNWTLNQTKIFMYALSQLYKHKIKIDHTEYTNSNVEEVDIDHIPRKISISKDEIINITKLPISQFAREIRNITYGIMESVATIPSLNEPDNPKSYRQRKWFEEFEYLDGKGILTIEIDKYLLPYLVVFANYIRIKLSDIFSFKHNYSCDLYIHLKLNFNRHVSINQIRLSLIEFKSIVNMEKAYSNNTAMFQKKIIVNAVNEINSLTDLSLDYELHKTGKRFTDITLKFSQKKDISKQLDQPKCQPQEIEHQAPDAPLNLDVNDQDIIIAAQLQSYGIPRNKALEYVKTYGKDICKVGIEKLLGEIQKGRDIKNISGYLVSCIENAGNNSSSKEIKSAMDAADELVQDRKAQEMKRFNSFDTYINNNEQQILVLLARYEASEKLTDELEIDMLRCLKDVVAQYEDLESMSPYYLTLRFKGDMLNYAKIKSLVDELEVATKEERIAKLKAELEAKKMELEEVSGKAKGLVEKEITMLKVAIADLV